jgi:hypothetical protein
MLADYTTTAYYPTDTTQTTGVTSLLSSNAWLRRAQRKLKELSELQENWDGYGSPQIEPEALEIAAELVTNTATFGMPEPQIFPVPGGGLQIEWERLRRELELEILPNGEIEFLLVDRDGEMRENKVSPNWKGEIYRLVQWFKSPTAKVNEL